jgi:hypothetical protein
LTVAAPPEIVTSELPAWVSDASKWCLTLQDLVRWCLDQVPEEPRATAPPEYASLARTVEAVAEHSGSGHGFRDGDLFYSAMPSGSTTGLLTGRLTGGKPGAPALNVKIRVREKKNSELDLIADEVEPEYRKTTPLVLTPHLDNDQNWDGLAAQFGPWWVLLTPGYESA